MENSADPDQMFSKEGISGQDRVFIIMIIDQCSR